MARRTIQLSELISEVREKGDYENSTVFTDSILTKWINEAIAEVWDLLVECREDHCTTETTITTVVDTEDITLPDDLYVLRGLHMTATGIPLRRSNIKEMGRYLSSGYHSSPYHTYLYRLQGMQTLKLSPLPRVAESITLYYIPYATKLVNGTDTFDGISGYERLVVEKTLVTCDLREGRSTDRMGRVDKWEAAIKMAANDRDQGGPFLLPDESGMEWLP